MLFGHIAGCLAELDEVELGTWRRSRLIIVADFNLFAGFFASDQWTEGRLISKTERRRKPWQRHHVSAEQRFVLPYLRCCNSAAAHQIGEL
ncbi:hypothetical protein PUN28_015936 [Cardiocondyla obscurior]|uniref:Uncharacterized protein n=1 Tax=Cardiocondyla obscurior TaxID=286306 RepID=A0AAW2EQ48_9HYME